MTDVIWHLVGAVIVLALVLGVLYIPFRAIESSGKVEFCYIRKDMFDQANRQRALPFFLYGYVDWREDPTLGEFATNEEALEHAKSIGCEVRP